MQNNNNTTFNTSNGTSTFVIEDGKTNANKSNLKFHLVNNNASASNYSSGQPVQQRDNNNTNPQASAFTQSWIGTNGGISNIQSQQSNNQLAIMLMQQNNPNNIYQSNPFLRPNSHSHSNASASNNKKSKKEPPLNTTNGYNNIKEKRAKKKKSNESDNTRNVFDSPSVGFNNYCSSTQDQPANIGSSSTSSIGQSSHEMNYPDPNSTVLRLDCEDLIQEWQLHQELTLTSILNELCKYYTPNQVLQALKKLDHSQLAHTTPQNTRISTHAHNVSYTTRSQSFVNQYNLPQNTQSPQNAPRSETLYNNAHSVRK